MCSTPQDPSTEGAGAVILLNAHQTLLLVGTCRQQALSKTQMARKRTAAETMYSDVYVELNQKSKRTMVSQEEQCEEQFFFKLPKQQQQQELGSFWISIVQPKDINQAQRQPSCGHKGAWASEDHGGISLSLSLAPCRTCADAEDRDMQDTASSGGSSHSSDSSQRALPAARACAPAQGAPAAPAAAATGEEDSITSGQRPMPAGACAGKALFAYGSAGHADVDVSSLYCWEVLHNVLDGL